EQDRGPVDGVKPQHALAGQVHPPAGAGPPPAVVPGFAGAVAERGDVVAERVPPDVDHLAGIAGDGYAPAAGPGRGARRAEVLEPARDEAEHLVAPPGGLDPEPARADQVVQLAGVPGQPEEPVLLRDGLRLGAVFRAPAARQVGRPVELLAAHAVPALVVLQVQIAAGRAGLPQLLPPGPVPRLVAGADE